MVWTALLLTIAIAGLVTRVAAGPSASKLALVMSPGPAAPPHEAVEPASGPEGGAPWPVEGAMRRSPPPCPPPAATLAEVVVARATSCRRVR